MRPVLVVFLLMSWLPVAAAAAGLASVVKCLSADGRAIYQATPCGAGMTQAWSREIPSREPPPSAPGVVADRRRRVAESASDAATVRGRPRADAAPPQDPKVRACETAKLRRADRRDRHWRTIRFDELRALDDEVARACRR